MGFSLGIVGLPNVGKSTIFNALSCAGAEVSNYPFCTKDKNNGIVEVPDERLVRISRIMKSPKAVPTVIEFVDIAGLVKGASNGEGLGNQFLSYIREVDAVAHVVRCFPDPNVVHVDGSVDPKRDIEIINAELALSDLASVSKKLSSVRDKTKTGDKKFIKQAELLEGVKEKLGAGVALRNADLSDEQKDAVSDVSLLTIKPLLYVLNVDEGQLSSPDEKTKEVLALADSERSGYVVISGKLEAELSELSADEAAEYQKGLGIKERGLSKLIREGYNLLDLITFFTSNEKETRAWTVKNGTTAPRAAGKVHSDMEKGFISAEIIQFDDLVRAGSHAKAKEMGVARTEGKSYIIKDGDIANFRFNV